VDLMAVQTAVKARVDAALLPLLDTYAGWPDALSIPVGGAICVVVPNDGVSIEYGQNFGGDSAMVHLELHVLVTLSGSGAANAQITLSPYISNTGSTSLLQILRGDPQLNSTVRYARPLDRVRNYGQHTIGSGLPLFGAVLDLDVLVD
jgi:hypothetical protein